MPVFILLPRVEGSEADKIREGSERRISELRMTCAHREIGDWWNDWLFMMPVMTPPPYEIRQCRRCESIVAARRLCYACNAVVREESGPDCEDRMDALPGLCPSCQAKRDKAAGEGT
ncbi:MAG: hypothetical protein G01um101425_920 [Candidatus Peregrinibacteria bacterium Gr01-1014_25]|nr:MAG: hypothetical protein G01um101425_920 [Candidatus Peregrinibacteria bacterium Gr01-1014_25]